MKKFDMKSGSANDLLHAGIDRRDLLRGAAVGLGAAAMAGTTVARAQGDPVELTIATDWTEDARASIMEQAVAEFERQFPQYKLKVEPIGGDYFDALSVQIAGGTAADVMLFSGATFVNFQEQGAFADITPQLTALGIDMSRFTNVPEVFRAGDQQFAMPFQLTITTWFANIDMFEAAGVELPGESWTWDDMLATAQALTNADEGQYGIWMPNSAESHWGPLVLSAGGNWMNADRTKTALGDGSGFDGFKFAVDLVNEYKVSPTPAETVSLISAATSSPFVAGHTAMTPANSSSVGNYGAIIGDRFRWQPIPQPSHPATGGLRTTYNDQPHVVNAKAKDIQGAAQLAAFMSSDFVQGLIASQRGSTPVLLELQQSAEYLASPPNNMEQVGKNLAFAEDLGFTRNWLEWFQAIQSASDLAFIGEASAEDAFASLLEAGDAVLAQN